MSDSASGLPTHGTPREEALATLKRLLRRLRVERGLSMAGLTLRAGLGRTTASQALNGDSIPSEPTLISLAKGLRASTDPLLELRSLAVAWASELEQAKAGDETRAKTAATDDRRARETRFTYEYLAQRPTSLLRTLHDKRQVSHVAELRIRTVDIFQSWYIDDAELPLRSAQYADECLNCVGLIRGLDEGAEAVLLLATLTELNESRSDQDKAHAQVTDDINGSVIVFLDTYGVESLSFLQTQGLVCSAFSKDIPPWSALDDVRSVLDPECFPP